MWTNSSRRKKPTKVSGSGKNEASEPSPYQYAEGVLTLHLHLQPGAARSQWAGVYGGGSLKLRVAAVPVDGKANRALVKFLADAAGVPSRSITILRGEYSREKTIRIAPLTTEQFQAMKTQWQS